MSVDDDNDGEEFSGLPSPAMRSWRHPSEVAADAALARAVERKRSLRNGLTFAAGILIGAGGVLIGVASFRAASSPTASLSLLGTTTTVGALSTSLMAPIGTMAVAEPPTPTSGVTLATSLLGSTSAPEQSTPLVTPDRSGLVMISSPADPETVLSNGIVTNGIVLTSASVLAERRQFLIKEGTVVVEGHLLGVDPFTDLAVLTFDESAPLGELDGILLTSLPSPGSAISVLGADPTGVTIGDDGALIALNQRTQTPSGQDIIGSIETTAMIGELRPGALVIGPNGEPLALTVNSDDVLVSAIPLADIVQIAEGLRAHGWPTEAWLGVSCTSTEDGLRLDSVLPGSPASHIGLSEGDVLVRYNGVELASVTDLVHELRRSTPGTNIELFLRRESEPLTITVELGYHRPGTALSD